MNKFYNNLHEKWLLVTVIGFLAVIPFFWLNIGEMDLGGDATRLYFYDPLSYFKNYSLYAIEPLGTGRVETNFYILPVMLFFLALKFSPDHQEFYLQQTHKKYLHFYISRDNI